MGVKKKVLKAATYAAAPKLAFMMNNPRKAGLAKASAWAGKQMLERAMPERFRPQPARSGLGMMAAKGLGAAALAAPLGWWLGRRLMSQDASR